MNSSHKLKSFTQKLAPRFFIGWDVGGWNCDNNRNSRDAVIILDEKLDIAGRAWRGNLRRIINEANDTSDFLNHIFCLCGTDRFPAQTSGILAIDTPLGFPEALINLIKDGDVAQQIEASKTNPYLFRKTEQWLFEKGLKPLSPIKDMIGSQASKGMHVVARFAPQVHSRGVWTDGEKLTAIEVYPSACKASAQIQQKLKKFMIMPVAADKIEINKIRFQCFSEADPHSAHNQSWVSKITHPDIRDALICAVLAWQFHNIPNSLAQPVPETPASEGWIFVPKDGLNEHNN